MGGGGGCLRKTICQTEELTVVAGALTPPKLPSFSTGVFGSPSNARRTLLNQC